MQQLIFSWTDYILFGSLLGLSLVVGIYFGFFSKQDSVSEYLFGGRKMGYLPVTLSIIASALSGITFLGIPTEVYLHGFQFIWININTCLTGLISAYIFLPVFYKLQVYSVFEYLELRFSRKIRALGSLLYMLSLSFYIPIVIYVPALAFSQVTGYNIHVITCTICAFCITYTSVGGVKAVVWTDTIQFIFTVGGFYSVLVLGLWTEGFFNTWKTAKQGGRLDIYNFNPSPFVRNTFWAISLGSLFPSLSHAAVGQKFVQRYLAIESQTDINKALLLKTIGVVMADASTAFMGLLIYRKYHDCDPESAKLIEHSDQIVPYYVLDITRNLPGMAGIFLAGIVSSALSAMSAGINTLSGLIYDDFIEKYIPESPGKDAKAAHIMKIISVIVGIISIGMIFVIERMGTVIEITYSLRGAIDGPILGLFIIGMFIPWVGKKGALVGALVSMAIMSWITVGSKWHTIHHNIRNPILPMTIENCTYPLNETKIETLPPLDPKDEPMILYQISIYYIAAFGTIIHIVVAMIYSFLTGETDVVKVDLDHIAPPVQRFFRNKKYIEVSLNEIPERKITPD